MSSHNYFRFRQRVLSNPSQMYHSLTNRKYTYFGKGNTIFENWGAWVGASQAESSCPASTRRTVSVSSLMSLQKNAHLLTGNCHQYSSMKNSLTDRNLHSPNCCYSSQRTVINSLSLFIKLQNYSKSTVTESVGVFIQETFISMSVAVFMTWSGSQWTVYGCFYSNPNPLISWYNGIRASPIHNVGVLKSYQKSDTVCKDLTKIYTTSHKANLPTGQSTRG